MQVLATLTEIRKDKMQKWEREDLDVSNNMRYIWLAPYQSKPEVIIGSKGKLEFVKGSGGQIGGHWAAWIVKEIVSK